VQAPKAEIISTNVKVNMCYLSSCITTINCNDILVYKVLHKNYSPITNSV